MADQQRKIEDMTFKEASIELEQIVRSLESGDLELEDSAPNFSMHVLRIAGQPLATIPSGTERCFACSESRGVELLRSLRERLANAEQKVRVLLDATDENAATTDTSSAPSTAYLDE